MAEASVEQLHRLGMALAEENEAETFPTMASLDDLRIAVISWSAGRMPPPTEAV